MNIIRPGTMRRLWWLNPWATARALHQAITALKPYADRIDDLIDIQSRVIDEQSAEIRQLRERLADLHDSITAGASVPDAHPHE